MLHCEIVDMSAAGVASMGREGVDEISVKRLGFVCRDDRMLGFGVRLGKVGMPNLSGWVGMRYTF